LQRLGADLVLLDVMLPDADGFDICRRIRSDAKLRSVPVILLTAKGEEIDRILGLELGADDYVVKPFSPRELVARAKAVLRRKAPPTEDQEILRAGALCIDCSTHEVRIGDRSVELSALEFRLLLVLASHPRRIFSRNQLLDQAWGRDHFVTLRTVDVHIRRLREKMEDDPGCPVYIQTVRGSGYRFCPHPAGTSDE
jgi:DNA-binding response OmpR family regulator